VPVEAGEIPPAPVMTQLDEPRAELRAEQDPPEKQDRNDGWSHPRRTEERGEEPGLEQHRLPPERVEGLPDVDDREVERPEQEPRRDRQPDGSRLGEAEERGGREKDSDDGDRTKEAIAV